MSTLQHTYNSSNLWTRMALAVALAGAVVALMAALISSSGGRPDPLSFPGGAAGQPSQAQVERQLEAAAGPRYQQPVGIHDSH